MPDAEAVFLRLASLPHCLFLDSAMRLEKDDTRSFVLIRLGISKPNLVSRMNWMSWRLFGSN